MPTRRQGPRLHNLMRNQTASVKAEMVTEIGIIGDEFEEYYGDIVRRWQNKPSFQQGLSISRNAITLEVFADGRNADIWYWVNIGTGLHGPRRRAYPIRPKRPGYPLKFQAGYNAYTQPTARYDVGDGSSFGPTVRTYEVMHPGIEGREFIQEARKNQRRTFVRRMQDAIKRGVRNA